MGLTQDIAPHEVQDRIRKHLIGDGFPLVFDLERSHGSWIVDARDGDEYLDFYTFFASLPLGFRHPVFDRAENRERLLQAALYKPSNSDAFTLELARFVETFAGHAMPSPFRHLFFVEGGALAVGELGSQVLHFREAFHGRSGYTLSLTNTLPVKIAHFPKFDWPRVTNPKLRFPVDAAEEKRVAEVEARALGEVEGAFRRHPHDIAAIIIEPIQGEGGDNHFRGEFLRSLRGIADREDALLIFDEVQTGFGSTGRMWAFQHFDVVPDIVCFGKKTQVCGIMAGPRVDEVHENVFRVPSRINSTWGGNLTDMVRCEIILEAMAEGDLVANAARVGDHLCASLAELARRRPEAVSNPRGLGLLSAIDARDRAHRDAVLRRARENRLLVLACGEKSIRLRPNLVLTAAEAEEGVRRLERSL
jgi:L-lysine 6-transaminase